MIDVDHYGFQSGSGTYLTVRYAGHGLVFDVTVSLMIDRVGRTSFANMCKMSLDDPRFDDHCSWFRWW